MSLFNLFINEPTIKTLDKIFKLGVKPNEKFF
jgi:hypothetical protein